MRLGPRRIRIRRVDLEKHLQTPLAPASSLLSYIVIVWAGITPKEFRKSVGPFSAERAALDWLEANGIGLAPTTSDWASVVPLMTP